MNRNIIRLKVPFKQLLGYREKEVEFMFRIMTLEMICEHLGIDFGEDIRNLFDTGKINDYDLSVSIIWNGYLAACKEQYKKPKYNFIHALVWHEYMSQESRNLYIKEVNDLWGRLKGGKDQQEKDQDSEKKK